MKQPTVEQIIYQLQQLKITDYEITDQGINVFGDVKIPVNSTEIPIQFNIVSGSFHCSYTKITSLRGAPREVGGSFYCTVTKITSLEGAPREVGGSFGCCYTPITSLKGAPREVGGHLDCYCTNMEGKPDTTGINIDGELKWN